MNREQKAGILRELLIEAMRGHDGSALLLSGGVDSASALAALLALGKRPHVFTFRLSGFESVDYQVSRSMAEHFSLPFHPVVIPQDPDCLYRDLFRIMPLIQGPWKTHVQCTHPFLYLCPQILEAGMEEAVYCGAGSDCYGDGRKAMVAFHQGGEAAYRAKRADSLDHPTETVHSIRKACAHYGIRIYDPYRLDAVRSFFLSLTFAEMNRPRFKYIGLLAFPEFWKEGRWYRMQSNYQINSGIRAFHDTLLKDPVANPGNRFQAVVGIYNRIWREGNYGNV